MKKLLLLLVLVSIQLLGKTQAGFFDPSFGKNGYVTSRVETRNELSEVGRQIILLEDGKFLAVWEVAFSNFMFLVRYLPNGTIDESFGFQGFSQNVRFTGARAALRKDGKVVVAGSFDDASLGKTRLAVAMFDADGLLDKRFGNQGISTLTSFQQGSFAKDVALQQDGKILVIGGIEDESSSDLIARFNENGTLDSTFDADGISFQDLPDAVEDINALAVQDDGKILVSGSFIPFAGGEPNFGVARFNANGSLDQSFGYNGALFVNFYFGQGGNVLALQKDGKVLVAGTTTRIDDQGFYTIDFAIARLNANGTLDLSFSNDGKQTIDFGFSDEPTSLVIQPDGKILVAGVSTGDVPFSSLARLNADGSLDATFGNAAGKMVLRFPEDEIKVNDIKLLPDGKILAAGTVYNREKGNDFLLSRINEKGSVDVSFGKAGFQLDFYPFGYTLFYNLAVQQDGKVVTVGMATLDENQAILARYLPTGVLDPGFGTGGTIHLKIGAFSVLRFIAIQPDGKILVAGGYYESTTDLKNRLLLLRFNPDGTPDDSFGQKGMASTELSQDAVLEAMSLLPNGKILLDATASDNFLLMRYQPNGTRDLSFGRDGQVMADFGGTEQLVSLAVQKDGKMVVLGSSYKFIPDNMGYKTKKYLVLARYHENGLPDNNFATGGSQVIDYDVLKIVPKTLSLQQDGKIIVAGMITEKTMADDDLVLLRFAPNGNLDPLFGNRGQLTIDLGKKEYLTDLKVQVDDKILLSGFSEFSSGSRSDYFIMRCNANGTRDEEWGGGGVQITDIGPRDYAEKMAISGNRLYVAGYLVDYATDGLLAAYQMQEPAPALLVSDVTVQENEGRANLTIKLSRKINQSILLGYTTVDGTARQGLDFQKQAGRVSIPAGSLSTRVSIRIKADKQAEGSEYFQVDFQPISFPEEVVIKKGIARVTINDGGAGIQKVAQGFPHLEGFPLNTTVFPNPSSGAFNLQISSGSDEPIYLVVVNAAGSIVETRKVGAKGTVSVGGGYLPGVYRAEIKQGAARKVLAFVKVP